MYAPASKSNTNRNNNPAKNPIRNIAQNFMVIYKQFHILCQKIYTAMNLSFNRIINKVYCIESKHLCSNTNTQDFLKITKL